MGLSVDTLAEGAVVFPPPVPVGADLAVGVAAGGVVERIDGIFTHRATLPLRHIVSFAVQFPTLGGEADGDAPLAPTEPTVVHSKHVSIVILHTVEHAGWLCFFDPL